MKANKPVLNATTFTKANFLKWFKKQAPEREFEYADNFGCLIGSFCNEFFAPLNEDKRVWAGTERIRFEGKEIEFNEWFERLDSILLHLKFKFTAQDVAEKLRIELRPLLNKRNFTKANFLRWLNQQPNERSFLYLETKTCLFASFAKEFFRSPKGLPNVSAGGSYVAARDVDYNRQQQVVFSKWFFALSSKLQPKFTIEEVKKMIDTTPELK